MTPTGTKQDPEGRRLRILQAAADMIAEVGPGRLTHRAIAARAGVAVGSTTYYFPTLADLAAAALERIGEGTRAEIADWTARVDAAPDVPGAVADLVLEYLDDRTRAIRENELYLAAARAPELRPAARIWRDGLIGVLLPRTDAVAAVGVAAVIDGVVVQSLATGDVPDRAQLRDAVARLLHAPVNLHAP